MMNQIGVHALVWVGGWSEAECRKAIEMDENFVTARWILGRAEQLSGRYDNAIAEFEHGLRLEPENTVLRAALARAHAAAGATAKAEQVLGELDRTNTRRYVSALDLASVHAALNQRALDSFGKGGR